MERPETHELKYMHFSVAVSKSRRMPIFSACNIKGAAAKTTFWLTPNTATCDCASSRAPFFRQMLDPVQFKAEVLFESPNHVCFLMCIPKSQESGRAMLRPYAYDVDGIQIIPIMMDHLNSATIGFVYALAIRVSCFFPRLGWNIPPLVDHHRQVDDVTAQHGSVIAAICICQSFRGIHIFFGQYRYTQNWVKSALDIQMTF